MRHQRPGDVVVVNADDASADFAGLTAASLHELSLQHGVERGAFLDPRRGVVLAEDGRETVLGHVEAFTPHPLNVVAAVAIAAAAGAPAAAVEPGVRAAPAPNGRAQAIGSLAGVPVIDDGMAATPAKAAALLGRQQAASIVLVAGGLLDAGGGPVHCLSRGGRGPRPRLRRDRACRPRRRRLRRGRASARATAPVPRGARRDRARPGRGGTDGLTTRTRGRRRDLLAVVPGHSRRPGAVRLAARRLRLTEAVVDRSRAPRRSRTRGTRTAAYRRRRRFPS